jgi:hypothetical protein
MRNTNESTTEIKGAIHLPLNTAHTRSTTSQTNGSLQTRADALATQLSGLDASLQQMTERDARLANDIAWARWDMSARGESEKRIYELRRDHPTLTLSEATDSVYRNNPDLVERLRREDSPQKPKSPRTEVADLTREQAVSQLKAEAKRINAGHNGALSDAQAFSEACAARQDLFLASQGRAKITPPERTISPDRAAVQLYSEAERIHAANPNMTRVAAFSEACSVVPGAVYVAAKQSQARTYAEAPAEDFVAPPMPKGLQIEKTNSLTRDQAIEQLVNFARMVMSVRSDLSEQEAWTRACERLPETADIVRGGRG